MTACKTIEFEKSAKKFIAKQPPEQQKRLLKAIKGLPESGDIKKMKGYQSLYRLRVGDYRVLYYVNINGELTVVPVSDIDSRGQINK